jgi:hypothetical protein
MYLCPIRNGIRDKATSILLHSCKVVDKEIKLIVSNIGIYCSSDKVGTVYLIQYIYDNPTFNISSGATIAEAVNLQLISIFGICDDVRHFAQYSYSVTVNSYNGQLTLHTDSHASYSGAVQRQ